MGESTGRPKVKTEPETSNQKIIIIEKIAESTDGQINQSNNQQRYGIEKTKTKTNDDEHQLIENE